MDKVADKERKTRLALLWMNLTSEPLIALYSLIPFILRKELGSASYQIALFTMLSPVLAVFSFYWGSRLSYKRNHLLPNLIGAWILARLPFLFFPFFDNFWFFLFSCGIYQLFSRASTPALMEILKRNLPKKSRNHLFSLYYLVSVIEGIAIGLLLSGVTLHWKFLFFFTALASLTSIFLQARITLEDDPSQQEILPHRLSHPWKKAFDLLRERPDFATFQWGFMIGGFALMLIAPVRSIYSADILSVTLNDFVIAKFIFVGLGMAGSSLFWKKGLEKWGVNKLTVWILLGFALFPLAFLLTPFHLAWFYLAHLFYGIAQGGSHLVWHLSGTIFARDQDSSPFTTVNVLMVGLRGAVGPLLGSLLSEILGPIPTLFCGASIAFIGVLFMAKSLTIFRAPAKI
jgi:MFS family permease